MDEIGWSARDTAYQRSKRCLDCAAYQLEMGFEQQQHPSAPPLPAASANVPPGYPPIVAPGAPVMHPAQQPVQHHPAAASQPALYQQPMPAVMHPSALPALRPPAVHVVEQHTYVHLPAQDELPLITRSSCHLPRQITCPNCYASGPTVVTRQAGCCAYLACFGLCWVCCPLFWLPFCLDCDKDLVHRCGACGAEVARVAPCS